MNMLISLVPLIVMFTLIPTIFASSCKLSAYVLRRRIVNWKQCYAFAFILVLLSFLVNILVTVGGVTLPPVIGIVLAFGVQVGIGAWFFSHRATHANGQQLGLRGGAELTALSWLFLAAIGVALFFGVNYLQRTL